MVFLDNIIALFFLSLALGIFILLISKKNNLRVFSFLSIFMSGIFLISTSELTAENITFIALGLRAFLLILTFQMRDSLVFSLQEPKLEDKEND